MSRAGPKSTMSPAWARNGKELFYVACCGYAGIAAGSVRMYSVALTLAPTFSVNAPRTLFEGNYSATTPTRGYDVTDDGQRFLMVDRSQIQLPAPATHMFVVLNWTEELKRLAPAK